MFTVCSVCVQQLFTKLHSQFTICAFPVCYMCVPRSLYVRFPFATCAFPVRYACVPRSLCVHSPVAHHVFTACSLLKWVLRRKFQGLYLQKVLGTNLILKSYQNDGYTNLYQNSSLQPLALL